MGSLSIVCPHCNKPVTPTRYGKCPTCRKSLPRSAEVLADSSDPAPVQAAATQQQNPDEDVEGSSALWTAPVPEQRRMEMLSMLQLGLICSTISALALMIAAFVLPITGDPEKRMLGFDSLFFGIPAGLANAATIHFALILLRKRRLTGFSFAVTVAVTVALAFVMGVIGAKVNPAKPSTGNTSPSRVSGIALRLTGNDASPLNRSSS